EVHLRLTHRWSSQPLPVATPVPVQLGDGELTTTGTLDALTVQGQTHLRASDQPITVRLRGQDSLDALHIETLTITSGEQHLALAGQVHYPPNLSWQLHAQGRHLDPAVLAPQWPGELTLDATS